MLVVAGLAVVGVLVIVLVLSMGRTRAHTPPPPRPTPEDAQLFAPPPFAAPMTHPGPPVYGVQYAVQPPPPPYGAPPPPLPPYGAPPPPGYPYAAPYARPTTSGLAVASLVLGVIGWVYGVPAIVALICGYSAKKQIRQSNGAQSGDGMATAGIALGWVFLGLWVVLFVVAFLVGFAKGFGDAQR